MYRRPKFLEELLEIREQMSRDSYYDADLFAEQVRSGKFGVKNQKSEAGKKSYRAKNLKKKTK